MAVSSKCDILSNVIQETGQKRAVLIGINHYLDEAIGNLSYCVNDVVELNDILSDERRGSFWTQPLHSGIGNNKLLPNRSNILSMINLLASNSEENDTIFVYFAGHGFEKERVNYLLPADARLDVLVETAIPLKWVKETLSKSLAKKKFLIIDACHAGAGLGRSSSLPMSKSFQEELFERSEGFAIMSSCKTDQLSYDFAEKSHGAFSYYMLEGLRGAADGDEDNIITVPDVNQYVSRKMHEWCIKNQLQQNPTFSYNVAGDFIFVRVPEKTGKTLPSLVIKKAAITEVEESKTINDIIDNIAFSSFEEIMSDNSDVEQLTALILREDNLENKIRKVKLLLKEVSTRRFSSKLAVESIMDIIKNGIEIKEIKKWIRNEETVKKFLILEFITSNNFNYAGTMAQIIEKLLPIFSDEEIKEIVTNIKGNGQIISSFKARSSLISIIDSCKNILPLNEFMDLKSSILGN